MTTLKVVVVLAFLLALSTSAAGKVVPSNKVVSGWKIDDYFETKCRDVVERKKAACVTFCENNPQRCLEPSKSPVSKVAPDTVKIFSTTFNVGGINPPTSLSDWVSVDTSNPPDILVYGLQEMVELKISKTPVGILKEKKWVKALREAVPSSYSEVGHVRLIGIFLMVFKRTDSAFSVSDVKDDTVGTGIMNFGNKGGAGISMTLNNNFKLLVINCHLAAGLSQMAKRNKDWQAITKKMKFSKKGGVFDHDAVIWMGDTNSRLNTKMTYEEVTAIAKNDEYQRLYEFDQIKEQREKKAIFVDFAEMKPTFRPTYKYDVGTDVFDTSEKKRLPAWTDRIMHWEKEGVTMTQDTYTSVQKVMVSDHKPVQSLMTLSLNAKSGGKN